MGTDRVYFISDTHMGDGSNVDRFRYPEQLLDLLAHIQTDSDAQLVLLGDILELWTCSLEMIMVRHAPILKAFIRLADTRPVTYVVGNHDCLPWYYYLGESLGRIRIAEEFSTAQGRLVAVHGHQFDPVNQVIIAETGKVLPPWTRKLVQVLGLLERAGGEKTSNAIDDLSDQLLPTGEQLSRLIAAHGNEKSPDTRKWLHFLQDLVKRQSPGDRGYPPEEGVYEEGALRFMRAGARFVVMGHTHHPLSRAYGPRRYINAGSWVSERYPPTYARYAGGQLELLDGNTHQPYVLREPNL